MSSKHEIWIGACDCKCLSGTLEDYSVGQIVLVLTEADVAALTEEIMLCTEAYWRSDTRAAHEHQARINAIINPE